MLNLKNHNEYKLENTPEGASYKDLSYKTETISLNHDVSFSSNLPDF